MHIYIYIHIFTYTYTSIYTHIHVYILHSHFKKCTQPSPDTISSASPPPYTHIFTYTYMYIYTHIYIHIIFPFSKVHTTFTRYYHLPLPLSMKKQPPPFYEGTPAIRSMVYHFCPKVTSQQDLPCEIIVKLTFENFWQHRSEVQ